MIPSESGEEARERGYERLNWTGLVASEGSGAAFGCLSLMSLNFFLSFNLCHCLKSAGVSCTSTLVRWCFARMYLYYNGQHLVSPCPLTHPFCKISALIINCIKVPCINSLLIIAIS